MTNDASRVVIFVDEIDVTRSLPFNTDEFFAAIRQCYVARATEPSLRGVTFCLLGTAAPAELIEDTRVSPFNIGRRIEVRDFTAAEAAPLALGLLRHGERTLLRQEGSNQKGTKGERAGERVLARILYWTGGHPYLTQRLCRAVAEHGSTPTPNTRSPTPQEVDRLCTELFLTQTAKEGDDNLALVRNRLLKSEADLASLLHLYGQVRAGKRVAAEETDPLVEMLRLAGIVRVQEPGFATPSARRAPSALVVRNRIYGAVFDAEWVRQHMPDAEVRRQREAYRRGVVRALGLASGIVAVVSGLAVYAFTQRNAAAQNARVASAKRVEATANARRAEENRQRADREAQQKAELAEQRAKALREAVAEKQRAAEQTRLATQRAGALRVALGARDTALGQAQRNATAARQQAALATRNAQRAEQEKERATQEARRANRNLYFGNMNLIQSDWEHGNVGRIVRLLAETRGSPHRGFEWEYWNRLCHLDLLTLQGHTGPVWSVSFSPDGKRIVTGSFDQTARVWDAATGHETLTLKGHTGPVYSVSFSPDGKRILTGGDDQTAKVWDAATGHVTFTLKGHTAPVLSVSFSPDGTRILTGSDDHTAKVWAGSRALAAKRTAVGAGPRSKARCGGEFSARREEARALLRAETRAER